eukprot:gene4630-8203_t
MGLFAKLLTVPVVLAATTFYYTRGVEEIDIKQGSLIDITGNHPYKDSFRIQMNKKIEVKNFTTKFFETNVFQPEKIVLSLFLDGKSKSSNFEVGSKNLIWTVLSKNENEILMKWSRDKYEGNSYYSVDENNGLVFGSTINFKADGIAGFLHKTYARILLKGAYNLLNKE